MRDPYEILGVSATDDAGTIRKAYKRLAAAHHPDRSPHPDAAERFKQVVEAYAALTDDKARRRFERRQAQQSRQSGRSPGASGYDPQAAYRRAAEQYRAHSSTWTPPHAPRPQHEQPPPRKSTRMSVLSTQLGNIAAVVLMAVYVWRSSDLLPLQPWLPAQEFAAHTLSSPIWITLGLGLSMILFPRWYVVPILVEEHRSIRMTGWVFLLLFPLLSAWLLGMTPHFRLGR